MRLPVLWLGIAINLNWSSSQMIDVDSQNMKKVPDTWKSAGATAGNFDNQCPKVKKTPFSSLSFLPLS